MQKLTGGCHFKILKVLILERIIQINDWYQIFTVYSPFFMKSARNKSTEHF
jgi:hypothetical protein